MGAKHLTMHPFHKFLYCIFDGISTDRSSSNLRTVPELLYCAIVVYGKVPLVTTNIFHSNVRGTVVGDFKNEEDNFKKSNE